MIRNGWSSAVLVCAVALAGCARQAADTKATASVPADPQAMVETGKRLAASMGCHDCHTPKTMGPNGPQLDETRLLAGHVGTTPITGGPALSEPWAYAGSPDMTAWSGPWGVSFASNLTPDPETGLGLIDEATFIRTIREGQYHGGARPLLPPMPWQAISHATDDELKALYAFLRSIPPVRNRVPQPIPLQPAEAPEPAPKG